MSYDYQPDQCHFEVVASKAILDTLEEIFKDSGECDDVKQDGIHLIFYTEEMKKVLDVLTAISNKFPGKAIYYGISHVEDYTFGIVKSYEVKDGHTIFLGVKIHYSIYLGDEKSEKGLWLLPLIVNKTVDMLKQLDTIMGEKVTIYPNASIKIQVDNGKTYLIRKYNIKIIITEILPFSERSQALLTAVNN